MRTSFGKSHWLLLLSLSVAAVACGGGSKDEVPPDSGSSFTGNDEDTSDASDTGSDQGDGNDAGTEDDAEVDAGDTLQASKDEAKAKGWVEGCYKKPVGNAELLNSCGIGWRTFDKTLYPSSWKEGGPLPALP